MTKLLTYTLSSKTILLAFLLALVFAFVFAAISYAQSPEDAAKKYGVTFPITELGGCSDFASCRTYCEDPVNANSCITYGKAKGFYQDDPVTSGDQKFLDTAKRVLGCDSVGACLAYCEIPANFDKCDSFAQDQGLGGGHINDPSQDQAVLAKAKEVLGCDSYSSCRTYCSDTANSQRCSDFAGQSGLRGGEHRVGPGGCTSEATCRSFCSDPANYQICKGFHDVSGGQFTGPGGCNSAESCRTYCQQNETECRSLGGPGGPPGEYNPQEMCNKTPNCAWSGNQCQCGFYGETLETVKAAGDYASYCQANPGKCQPGQTGGFDTGAQRTEFEKYCRENPDRCQHPTGTTTGTGGTYGGYSGDPATECARYGCTWSNNSCQCTNYPQYPTPPVGSQCPDGQYIGPGGYCISGSTYSPGPYSYPTPGNYSPSPYSYPTPGTGYSYPSPTYYSYPTPGSYSYPTPGSYSYPTPGSYSYPTPGSYSYPSPGYSYPSPSYGSPSYGSPSYGSPSYGSPSYGTPDSYSSPSYGSPSYGTPGTYATPGSVAGASTKKSILDIIISFFSGR